MSPSLQGRPIVVFSTLATQAALPAIVDRYTEATGIAVEASFAPTTALMARISRDLRHEAVTVLQEGEVPSARFSDWTMAYIGATPEQVADWLCLPGTTPVPDLFDGMRRDASRLEGVAQSVLSVLSADRSDPASGPQGRA